MNDPRLERQETLGINTNQSVAIIGVGGIGSWVALELGLAGVREIHLFDDDTVDTSNLNRLPVLGTMVNLPKTHAVKEMLHLLRGAGTEGLWASQNIYLHPNFHPLLKYPAFDWLVVSTDTGKSRDEAFAYAKKHKIKYIEMGAEGHGCTITGSPGDWESSHEADPGYAHVPVWVGPCVLAATVAAYYILLGDSPKTTLRLDWGERAQFANILTHREWEG